MVEQKAVADKAAKALLVERRILFVCTALVGASLLLWTIAFNSQSWVSVTPPQESSLGLYVGPGRPLFVSSRAGLFRICRTTRFNATSEAIEICEPQEMFPSEEKLKADPSLDRTIIKYTRTEMFFSIVSVFLMLMGFLFSIYSFRNPRYMFKRLCAGIHFLSAASVVVVIEVVINSVAYEEENLPYVHPKTALASYGYSFYMGWSVLAFNLSASVAFLLYSKKRKGSKAPTEEIALADEPTIIGR